MKPNFHFRIFPAKFIVEVIKIPEAERGQWVLDLATDLIDDNIDKSKTEYAKKIISETNEYREKFKKSGKLGGLAKSSNAKASLQNAKANSSDPLPNSSTSNKKKKQGGFQPPTPDEVRAYCLERGKGVSPQRWYDFYESKGWMIGKNKMKSWKAAIRTWEKDEEQSTGTNYEQY